MDDTTSVLIIDDHPLFREGVKAVLTHKESFRVVGEAGTASEGFALAQDLQPELILVDISLPDELGIELTRRLKKALPKARIIVITMHSRYNYISQAFKAGALGYVNKLASAEELLQGLQKVAAGEFFLDSSLSHVMIQNIIDSPEEGAKSKNVAYSHLTEREQEITRYLAAGHSSREIGRKLSISTKTVDNHRTNILNKLGLHSTLQLVRYAARLGLIDLSNW
jgi:DNA-binding NarL/FixJ family response regulator